MNIWIVLIIFTLIIMFIAWIGNGVVDRISDSIRNQSIRNAKTDNPPKNEMLKDRFK